MDLAPVKSVILEGVIRPSLPTTAVGEREEEEEEGERDQTEYLHVERSRLSRSEVRGRVVCI